LVGTEVGLGAQSEYWVLLLGVILLLVVLFMPSGLTGLAKKLWKRSP
jgi:ABC-type branched-subunit amino acid transport system permease subunit